MIFKKPGAVSWIVVFLGNPGLKYENTRHNAGFMTGDALSRSLGIKINKLRFKALTATCTLGGENVLLMKPQTYMNLSGEAVKQAADYYHVLPEHIIVVSDEMSLPIGSLRVKPKGSAGGHNGLKNIIALLGTDVFPRIRLGVGAPPHPDYDVKDWVLSAFHGLDLELMEETAKRASEAVSYYIENGPERTMNRFNG